MNYIVLKTTYPILTLWGAALHGMSEFLNGGAIISLPGPLADFKFAKERDHAWWGFQNERYSYIQQFEPKKAKFMDTKLYTFFMLFHKALN